MKPHWIVAVDGSLAALRAVAHVVGEAAHLAALPKISLVNVQAPLPADVSRFVESTTVEEYHRETGRAALAEACRKLDDAGFAYSAHVLIGETAQTITEYARQHGGTQIVMGARGLGPVVGILLGSVTNRVIHLTELPVVVVK